MTISQDPNSKAEELIEKGNNLIQPERKEKWKDIINKNSSEINDPKSTNSETIETILFGLEFIKGKKNIDYYQLIEEIEKRSSTNGKKNYEKSLAIIDKIAYFDPIKGKN